MPDNPTHVIEIAVNLDDVTAQVLGQAQQRLLEAGALDVWTVPIGMKKQRPGVMLSLLCKAEQRDELARLMLRLTGSMGVRFRAWDRLELDRRHETVTTAYGPVRLKIGSLDGQVMVARPEYEDVLALSRESGAVFRAVWESAQAAAEQWRVQREQQAS